MNTQQQINKIDQRLKELRADYKTASEGKKKFILSGVKIMKDKRKQLVLNLENGL